MNVLLIGGGGREHALAWSISASPLLNSLYVAPGNAGIAALAACVALDPGDHGAVLSFVRANAIGLVVVGPEAPLVAGLVDDLAAQGIKVFGPTRLAAQLEGSKGFTKELCRERSIPTADFAWFDTAEAALAHLGGCSVPVVVKADGLAAGKGVTVCPSRAEAREAVEAIFAGKFGGGAFGAGGSVIIEDFLDGEEASFFALVDGTDILPLVSAQDHKRVLDGDKGPNTGGMGAYSPAPIMTDAMTGIVMDRIIEPTVAAMAEAGTPYRGVLYAGLMIGAEGPKLIEYNVRFGDPETQSLVMRLKSDLLPALLATVEGGVEGGLKHFDLRWHDDAALTVVMAARGYPGAYETGSVIGGIDRAAALDGVEVFHAGTRSVDGEIVAAGGRVLAVTARAPSIVEAQAKAYRAVDLIDWPEGFCRRDIGWRAIEADRRG